MFECSLNREMSVVYVDEFVSILSRTTIAPKSRGKNEVKAVCPCADAYATMIHFLMVDR